VCVCVCVGGWVSVGICWHWLGHKNSTAAPACGEVLVLL